MENIKQVIKAQYSGNEAGLNWTKSFIKDIDESREIRKECLMNQLTLNRVDFANEFNPSVAIFGESQVGKSYLVDNLLTTAKSPLTIYDGKKEDGYGFIASINPIGGGKESTSLISRFTINRYSDNPEYPIRTSMLSPAEVVMILYDTYYNDVRKNHRFPEKEEIRERIKSMKERYANKPEVQNYIKDVDVFDIKEYVEGTLFLKGETFKDDLKETRFFEALSECIKSIDVPEWRNVFEFLWNGNSNVSKVFDKLISALQALGFSKECYIKIDPLLRKDGTILQVDRLYELFDLKEVVNNHEVVRVEEAKIKDMEVWNGEKTVTVLKSEFCALTTEVVFTIVEKNGDVVSSDLLKKKPFLEYMDVLDFPGARSRLPLDADQITKEDTCQMLLRGKVAYLFNKYSKQYLISNLMFCHHDLKSEVRELSDLLAGWIKSAVGNSPKERADYIRSSEISPLFIVGTKFNSDLVIQPIDLKGDAEEREQAKKARWVKRFNTNLSDLIGEPQKDPWLSEWTPGKPFTNMYLLRSYEYSWISNIYHVEKTEDGHSVEKDYTSTPDNPKTDYKPFIPELKRTFLENDFVQAHFENPEKSWEEAVGFNHDGSAWIIENLTKAAKTAHVSREMKFDKMLRESFQKLYAVLRKKYHDDKSDSQLKEALQDAGKLDIMLDALFGTDKFFFSDFIDTMLVREEDFHDVILNTINGIKVVDNTDLSVLFAIRDRAKILPEDSEDTARDKLKAAYHLASNAELDEFLQNYGLTMEMIINPPQVMNIGRIIVNAVEDNWFNEHLKKERFQEFVDRGLTAQSITSLFNRMKSLYYQELNMTERITEQIKPYISSPQQLDDMVDMLADLISEMINKFVNTMGTAYFGSGLWTRLKDTVEFNKFDINVDVAEEDVVQFDDEDAKKETNQVFDMFDNLEEILNEVPVNRDKLQHFSNYSTYLLWTERMKVAFLAICGVPNYDVNANNALKALFQNRIVGVNELKPLITSDMDISCFD